MSNDSLHKSLALLTSVGTEYTQFLPEYLTSLDAFTAGASELGWEITAVIVLDGIMDAPKISWPRNCEIVKLPWRSGTAMARTLALAYARSWWVYPLDADDLINASGAIQLLGDLESSPYAWLSTNRVSFKGEYVSQWQPCYRTWECGEIYPLWWRPIVPMHPNSICVLRNAALAVGGWPAVPVMEDMAFAFALTDQYAGLSTPHTVTRYREWSGQKTKRADRPISKRLAIQVIDEMARARRLRLGFPNPPPLIIPDDYKLRLTSSPATPWPEKLAAYERRTSGNL